MATGDHFDYLGRSMSPPPSAVKLFESRTGGETNVDFNHKSAPAKLRLPW
jgi:hypothetical protein